MFRLHSWKSMLLFWRKHLGLRYRWGGFLKYLRNMVLIVKRSFFTYSLTPQLTIQLQKEAKERNAELRDHWFRKLGDWHAFQLVFIDESGINSKLGERSYGYSKRGQVIRHKVTAKRSHNLSLLPALSLDGYFACNLYKGAVDAERFENFIRDKVLPFCTKYPGPRSIIVMDNASIHRGEVFCNGIKLIY